MSTLRTNTIANLDGGTTIDVEKILTTESGINSFEVVTTYSNLQLKTPSASGEIIYLASYRTGNPGAGGGHFISVSGSGTEDYGTVCVPNSSTTFYWKRINFTDITPQMFGALADGSSSDVTTFNRAINACISQGRRLFIPAGTYYLAGGISISSPIEIFGEEQQKTILMFADSVTGFTVAASTNYVRFRGLTIRNVSTGKTSGYHGIYANGGSISTGSIGFLDIIDCNILGFDCAFYGVACQLGVFYGSSFWACNKGIYTKLCVNMRYDLCKIQLNSTYGIHIDGDSSSVSLSAGTLINSCEIVNNGASSGGSVYVSYNEHFTLNNCMIDVPESGSTSHVIISNTSRGTISSCWVGSSNAAGINLATCTCINIVGCNIISSATYGLSMTGSTTGCTVNGCSFENNTSGDATVTGTGCLYNVFSGNSFFSTTASNSLAESGSYYTVATGNIAKKSVTLATGSGSVSSGNLVLS